MKWVFRIAGLFCLATVSFGQGTGLIGILSQELDRNFKALREKADPPPYFISYQAADQDTFGVSAGMGALQSQNRSKRRVLDVTVRTGSYELDNYRAVRGERPSFGGGVALPLDDAVPAIQRRIWLETDRVYRNASERLIKISTDQQVQLAARDSSPDFSKEEPSSASIPVKTLKVSEKEWADKVRQWSGRFAAYPRILNSGISMSAQSETKYLVNTEGTRVQHGRAFARISISAQTKAADGMDLALSRSFEAVDPAGLPGDREVMAAVDELAKLLEELMAAPVVEPYVGPAILSGHAAGVFFHEIFGHRVEGHRQKDEAEGQTFTKMVGGPVLPLFLSVEFDPTLRKAGAIDLHGWYDFDDEGVAARRVPLVEDGILKTFLMSRSPIEGFPNSNGHGRRQIGFEVVSRQSNLLVRPSESVPEEKLREMLREEVRRQNKPYGLYFDTVTGGYTTTGRRGLQAFAVTPVVVYRIFADGRPDELVRGADIVGTPLASFAKIVAAADRPVVFNGYCGAESGNVPVSAISPALLVSEIEIQKKQTSLDRPPLLPRPTD